MYLVSGNFENLTENDKNLLKLKGFEVQEIGTFDNLRTAVQQVPVNQPVQQSNVGASGLVKMYTFNLPSNPNDYDISLGGFSYFQDGARSVDSLGVSLESSITSPNFPTAPIGFLSTTYSALTQFARILAGRPHILVKARVSFSVIGQDANPMVLLSTYDKNGLAQSIPSVTMQKEAVTTSRQDFNNLSADYDFPSPIILNERNFLFYRVNANTACTLQLGILDAGSIGDSDIDTFVSNVKKSIGNTCY